MAKYSDSEKIRRDPIRTGGKRKALSFDSAFQARYRWWRPRTVLLVGVSLSSSRSRTRSSALPEQPP